MPFPSPLLGPCGSLILGLTWLFAANLAHAQDRLTFKDGHVQEGKVTSMNSGTVLINLNSASGAAGQIGFDLRLLNRVEVAPPPAFQTGMTAFTAGQWDQALAALKPLAEQFRGLPTAWAQQTAATLGDLYVEKNDLVRAQAAYNDYQRLYPAAGGNSLRFNLGQARLALARNDPAPARQQLDAITGLALKDPTNVSPTDSAAYGLAFYLLGQLQEHQGQTQEALDSYLRTVTLFYQDPTSTARAQKSADSLRAAHKDLVAP